MRFQTLISTMNLKNDREVDSLLKNMNAKNALIINQCPNFEYVPSLSKKYNIISCKDIGLSKSRNKAIDLSNGEICLIADDDMQYVNNYEQVILESYKKNPDADLIAFYVENLKPSNFIKEGKISFFDSLKFSSVQLSFKRKSIIDNNIVFDESFGTGSKKYISGEENIFLADCLKKKLKIYYVSEKIGKLTDFDSSWFKGFNESYFLTIGACYRRITKYFCFPLSVYLLIKRYPDYKSNISFLRALNIVKKGIGEQRQYETKKQ